MSISEENEDRKKNQPSTADAEEPIPLFILPNEADLRRINAVPGEKAGQSESVSDANFQSSPAEPRSEKIKVAAAAPVESKAETIRKTGLAWSAAIVFFGSVVFMLILGWFFDLLFGSSPWGIVLGIVLGSVIGFMQFFRITSRIINSSTDLQNTPLKLNENQIKPDDAATGSDESKII